MQAKPEVCQPIKPAHRPKSYFRRPKPTEAYLKKISNFSLQIVKSDVASFFFILISKDLVN